MKTHPGGASQALRHLFGLILALAFALSADAQSDALALPVFPTRGQWMFTGSMQIERSKHTQTLLASDSVLVVGGDGGAAMALASAELYSPASGTWTGAGNLATARYYHTATLLPNGKVLVTGGLNLQIHRILSRHTANSPNTPHSLALHRKVGSYAAI